MPLLAGRLHRRFRRSQGPPRPGRRPVSASERMPARQARISPPSAHRLEVDAVRRSRSTRARTPRHPPRAAIGGEVRRSRRCARRRRRAARSARGCGGRGAVASSTSPRTASSSAWLLRIQLAVSGIASSSAIRSASIEVAPRPPRTGRARAAPSPCPCTPRRAGCRSRSRRRSCGRRRPARASRRATASKPSKSPAQRWA